MHHFRVKLGEAGNPLETSNWHPPVTGNMDTVEA
jgi:hypothetical protein